MWAHKTTLWADETTVWVNSCKNQLENNFQGSHVYKGFPSIKNTHNHCVGTHNHCVPYWKTTFRAPCLPGPPPLLLLTTQKNHCVSRRNHCVGQFLCKNLLENNFQGPHVYKGFPYNTTHITTVWAHTTTVWAGENTMWVNSPVKTYWKTPFKGPMFIRGSPYKTIHITPVWPHTTTVYPTGKQLLGPRVYQGRPPPPSPPHNTINHCVSGLNHCVGQFLCKNLLENNFQGPTFIRGSPYNIPHITTVCAHTITVYTTGKQLSGPHVYQGFPPIKQHT